MLPPQFFFQLCQGEQECKQRRRTEAQANADSDCKVDPKEQLGVFSVHPINIH